MAGRDVAYRGSLIVNIVEVCHLDVASFGAWDDARARSVSGLKRDRSAYRKLLFTGDRLTGAIIVGPSSEIWTTNDVGMLKGLVQSGVSLAPYRAHLERDPFDVKPAYLAAGATRVVVMMDGLALDIDVLSRRVLGEADLRDDRVLTGIDGLVNVASRTEDLPKPLPLPGGHPGSFARRSAGFPG